MTDELNQAILIVMEGIGPDTEIAFYEEQARLVVDALGAADAEIEQLRLKLLFNADAAKDREHAEKYLRQAENLLTSDERTIHAEVARLREKESSLDRLLALFKEVQAVADERDAALARLAELERPINYTGDAVAVKQSGLPFKYCSCVARADDDAHHDGCEFWSMVLAARNIWHEKHVVAWSCAMESKGHKCCDRWCGRQESCTASTVTESSIAAAGASPQPSQSAEHWHSLYIKKCQELHDEKARLGAEIETLELAAIDDAAREVLPTQADAKDAARYRWLRHEVDDIGDLYVGIDSPAYPNRWALTGEEADAAIDAAILKGFP